MQTYAQDSSQASFDYAQAKADLELHRNDPPSGGSGGGSGSGGSGSGGGSSSTPNPILAAIQNDPNLNTNQKAYWTAVVQAWSAYSTAGAAAGLGYTQAVSQARHDLVVAQAGATKTASIAQAAAGATYLGIVAPAYASLQDGLADNAKDAAIRVSAAAAKLYDKLAKNLATAASAEADAEDEYSNAVTDAETEFSTSTETTLFSTVGEENSHAEAAAAAASSASKTLAEKEADLALAGRLTGSALYAAQLQLQQMQMQVKAVETELNNLSWFASSSTRQALQTQLDTLRAELVQKIQEVNGIAAGGNIATGASAGLDPTSTAYSMGLEFANGALWSVGGALVVTAAAPVIAAGGTIATVGAVSLGGGLLVWHYSDFVAGYASGRYNNNDLARELGGLAGGIGAVRAISGSTGSTSLVSDARARHILFGDGTGGGHMVGIIRTFNGKNKFPWNWSANKILNAVSEIATNPSSIWTQQTGQVGSLVTKSGIPVKFKVDGLFEGVRIRVIVQGNEIITGFPNQ